MLHIHGSHGARCVAYIAGFLHLYTAGDVGLRQVAESRAAVLQHMRFGLRRSMATGTGRCLGRDRQIVGRIGIGERRVGAVLAEINVKGYRGTQDAHVLLVRVIDMAGLAVPESGGHGRPHLRGFQRIGPDRIVLALFRMHHVDHAFEVGRFGVLRHRAARHDSAGQGVVAVVGQINVPAGRFGWRHARPDQG